MIRTFSILLMFFCIKAQAQLEVIVLHPKVGVQKTIVGLKILNDSTNAVVLARATCFLLDQKGKMAGRATKWVIGKDKHQLKPKNEITFNFVITGLQPFTTTNLVAKIVFTQIVLQGGQVVDPNRYIDFKK